MTREYVEVATKSGVVRGYWRETTGAKGNPRSAAFEGIPFAEAPVGDLRFMPPVPKAPWEGVLDALEFGPTAQRGDPGVTLIPEPSVEGESTLNVNVYTPSPQEVEVGKGLPVLVWIHGGGYFAGSPASPWYDGRNFNRDDVVTVTISYRLGFDGFGWIDGVPGNRGVRDWLAGLEWVQQNITRFGGDPGRVTIAGQSAGGGAVLTLLGIEKAQHLFHQVFALSAPIPDVSETKAKEMTQKIADGLGVPATLDGFRSVSEEQLLEVQATATGFGSDGMESVMSEGLNLGPTVDGDLIVRRTLESIVAGVGSDKPLVLGVTDDEFSMAMLDQEDAFKLIPSLQILEQFGVPKAAREGYLEANKEVAKKGSHLLAGRVVTDRMFKRNTLNVLNLRGNTQTWVYRWAWPSGTFGLAEHCLDVPFFFDCLDGPAMEPLAGANPPQKLADELHGDAVRFIAEGKPSWPTYKPGNMVRVIDSQTEDVPDGFASIYPLI